MKSFSLDQLVRVILSLRLFDGEVEIEKRGLTQGEKLHEDLVSDDEINRLWESPNHYIIMPHRSSKPVQSEFKKSEKDLYNSGSEMMFSDEEISTEITRYLDEP